MTYIISSPSPADLTHGAVQIATVSMHRALNGLGMRALAFEGAARSLADGDSPLRRNVGAIKSRVAIPRSGTRNFLLYTLAILTMRVAQHHDKITSARLAARRAGNQSRAGAPRYSKPVFHAGPPTRVSFMLWYRSCGGAAPGENPTYRPGAAGSRCFRSSSLAIWLRCTSSGPSAIRSVRMVA